MKRRKSYYAVMLIIGVCCVLASLFFHDNEVKAISGILIGVGAGFVGLSISNLLMKHIESKNPELEKQIQIDYNDERNTMIRDRAKAKAGDITQWLIMGIAYITILISAPLWVTLTVVLVFLAYNLICLYLMNKYQKEM
jgi:dolichol kinase